MNFCQAFPGASFKFCDESGKSLTPQEVAPPFRLSFQKSPTPDGPLVALAGAAGKMTAEKGKEIVTVTPYALPNPGPYPQVRRDYGEAFMFSFLFLLFVPRDPLRTALALWAPEAAAG